MYSRNVAYSAKGDRVSIAHEIKTNIRYDSTEPARARSVRKKEVILVSMFPAFIYWLRSIETVSEGQF